MLPLERSVAGCCHCSGPPSSTPAQSGTQSSTECPASPIARSRGAWEIAAGTLSLAVWVLMPKCPVCLTAYVALWTGLGLSFTAATSIRWALLAASGLLMLYVVVKRGMRLRWVARG
jgi:hypothetical protein